MTQVLFAVTEEYQVKVLSFMLHNHEFCDIAADALKPEYFTNRILQWFFLALANGKPRLTPVLLQEEMVLAARLKRIQAEELSGYVDIYALLKQKIAPNEEAHIREKMTAFMRTSAVKQALTNSIDLVKEEKWDEVVPMFQEAIRTGCELKDLGKFYFSTVEDRVAQRAVQSLDSSIPTGIPTLDILLNGGISKKQMGLIVGGTGRGKTVFMQWLARSAILTGKKVVYFSLELSEESIESRFDAMFAEVKYNELRSHQQLIVEEITKKSQLYGDALVVKHFPADTATVGTLKTFLVNLQNVGVRPDMIILDYLDLLKPHRMYKAVHEEVDAVTKAVVGLASEFDVAIWTATQMNRSGLAAATPDETNMGGYIGKQNHADMVLWLAQTPEEHAEQVMRIWVSKNRNGQAKRTVKLNTDYSKMIFYNGNDVDYQEEEVPIKGKPVFSKPKSSAPPISDPFDFTDDDNDGFDLV